MTLVIDSAVWFWLHPCGLAVKVLKLDVCTTDLVLDELIVGPSGQDLVQQGLQVHALSEDEVDLALRLRGQDPRLSFADASALALAQSKGYELAAHDQALEDLADKEGVPRIGFLDVVERMARKGLLTRRDVANLKKTLYDSERGYDKAAVKRIEKLVKK